MSDQNDQNDQSESVGYCPDCKAIMDIMLLTELRLMNRLTWCLMAEASHPMTKDSTLHEQRLCERDELVDYIRKVRGGCPGEAHKK